MDLQSNKTLTGILATILFLFGNGYGIFTIFKVYSDSKLEKINLKSGELGLGDNSTAVRSLRTMLENLFVFPV
jgi:hypothetical protein